GDGTAQAVHDRSCPDGNVLAAPGERDVRAASRPLDGVDSLDGRTAGGPGRRDPTPPTPTGLGPVSVPGRTRGHRPRVGSRTLTSPDRPPARSAPRHDRPGT